MSGRVVLPMPEPALTWTCAAGYGNGCAVVLGFWTATGGAPVRGLHSDFPGRPSCPCNVSHSIKSFVGG